MQYGGIEKSIASIVERALNTVFTERGIEPSLHYELKAEIEIPKEKSHGDLATNIAMRSAKFAKRSPLELANLLKANLDVAIADLNGAVERVEVKQPGFINFFLSKDFLCKIFLTILCGD